MRCDLDLGDMAMSLGHETIVRNIIQIQHGSKDIWIWNRFWLYVLCHLSWRYKLGQGHDTALGHTTIMWNIIKIQLHRKELWHIHTFWVCLHCDLDLGDMSWPLGHGQLCEILSRSNMTARSSCQDTDFGYLCTATLTLELWPLVKVMTHTLVMDNNCMNYYSYDIVWCEGKAIKHQKPFSVINTLWPWTLTFWPQNIVHTLDSVCEVPWWYM